VSARIHPTAIVDPSARIGAGCNIGPYCVIEDNVILGDNCRLHSHVVVGSHSVLGSGNEIFPFASIGQKSQDLKWAGGDTWLRVGDRNVFREFVTIHRATKAGEATVIGSGNLLLAYTHIAHDCRMGDHCILSNAAMLAGHCTLEDHVIIGGMTGTHQFVRVGRHAMLGGGSAIRQDVAPYMLAVGNPAETTMVNAIGLKRHEFAQESIAALRQAHKILFREGLTLTNALARIETELPQVEEIKHLVEFIRASERGITK
jgi:UDP-N-acetylglucosamine acyltransferase